MIRKFAVLIGVLSLAGCITSYPDLTQSRSPCRNNPGGWCDFTRDIAVESYAYAMLSANSYKDEDEYTALPFAFVEREAASNDRKGLAFSIFDRHAVIKKNKKRLRGKLLARVIAFRGTEFGSTSDIFSGALGDGQRDGARNIYAAERRYLDENGQQDVAIEVTGHSLGGALATQISIDNPNVKAYLFNSSPFFSGDPMMHDTNRISVSERGEFLRILRKYKAPPAENQLVINCSPSASAGTKHSISNLADCLTWIAAYGETEALHMISRNSIPKPEVECERHKVHPGLQSYVLKPGEVIPPCVHSPKPQSD